MSEKYIQFEKVPYEYFRGSYDWGTTPDCFIKGIWDGIKLPERSTDGSAGYDFIAPFGFTIGEHESIVIPTGICCKMDPGLVLLGMPRSSTGFNYGVHIANTVPVIDEDYYTSKNHGHILIKLTYDGIHTLHFDRMQRLEHNGEPFYYGVLSNKVEVSPRMFECQDGDKFCQMIAVEYHKQKDEIVEKVRTSGIGSTGK